MRNGCLAALQSSQQGAQGLMAGREACRVRVAGDVIDAQRLRVGDQMAEQTAPAGKLHTLPGITRIRLPSDRGRACRNPRRG